MSRKAQWKSQHDWHPAGRTTTWHYTIRKDEDGWYEILIGVYANEVFAPIRFARLIFAKRFCEKLHKNVLDYIDESKIPMKDLYSEDSELIRQFRDSEIIKKTINELGVYAPWMTTETELSKMTPLGSA